MANETAETAARLDPESAEWVRALAGTGPQREAALARLHALLVRIAHGEAARRGPRLRITGPELEDLACQAAADALLAITGKLGQFRGESRFTTWAYKFVILEVSSKIGRHFWRHPAVPLDTEDWDRLPDVFGFEPAREAEWRDLLAALRRAVDTELSPQQREVFIAIVVNQVPLDALVAQRATTRNAIYKTVFDARRKLRAALTAGGYLGRQPPDAPNGQPAGVAGHQPGRHVRPGTRRPERAPPPGSCAPSPTSGRSPPPGSPASRSAPVPPTPGCTTSP